MTTAAMIACQVKKILVIGLIMLNSTAAVPGKNPTGVVFKDPFLDQSGRRGPEMVYISGNSFIMGSNPSAPGYNMTEVPHRVELSTYAIGKYEVTNREYCEFLNEVGNNSPENLPYVSIDSTNSTGLCRLESKFHPAPGSARLPVVRVSWQGALAYTEWLSLKTGKNYSLPSEAQWECAARAGSSTIWPWGNTFQQEKLNCSHDYAEAQPQSVGQYPANAFGII